MGTYGISKKELILELVDCLDNVEGDFTTDDLIQTLDFLRFYAPTSDSGKSIERIWYKKLKDLESS